MVEVVFSSLGPGLFLYMHLLPIIMYISYTIIFILSLCNLTNWNSSVIKKGIPHWYGIPNEVMSNQYSSKKKNVKSIRKRSLSSPRLQTVTTLRSLELLYVSQQNKIQKMHRCHFPLQRLICLALAQLSLCPSQHSLSFLQVPFNILLKTKISFSSSLTTSWAYKTEDD